MRSIIPRPGIGLECSAPARMSSDIDYFGLGPDAPRSVTITLAPSIAKDR